MRLNSALGSILMLSSSSFVSASLTANETSQYAKIANDRLVFSVNKSLGYIDLLTLDGQDLLGSRTDIAVTPGGATGNGRYGIGPYLDCYCIPSGFYTPGSHDPTYKVFQGLDASNVRYGGVLFEQYWFLRDGETGLHTFSRIAYHNSTTPFVRNLQEFRTLFRPNTDIWTHLITDDQLWVPLPVPNPASGPLTNSITVQDATWYLVNRMGDAYVENFSDYYTKYTFAAVWRDQTVHGLFADGSHTGDKSTFGAWLMNTKDTYFGGPLHSDLVVDGIVYNYMVSNHHGAGTPNITDGLDRTFGPQYFHFNKAPAGASWQELRDEAVKLASPSWNADFYDSIAQHVVNYVSSSGRGSWKAKIALPKGAKNAVAVLAQDGVDFQANALDTTAYQYWADIDSSNGKVETDRIKAGTYRLTVYADGVFGDYIHDGIVVEPRKTTDSGHLVWEAESAGTELWRIGNPDKSAGEWRHGNTLDAHHPLHPPEYRIYFGAYDFLEHFPEGVHFHVGTSDPSKNFNYIHWSVFGGYANFCRPEQVAGSHGEINNWTITFDLEEGQLRRTSLATLTIQLAGAKTAVGNTDVFNASQGYNDLPFVVTVNRHELEPWIIPYYHSSSCGVRSGVVCYQVSHKFTFPTSYSTTTSGKATTNEIILSLPYNATDYESALLPRSVYVQYDALRLEVK